MTLQEVYEYFGSSYEACAVLGVTRQAFSRWNKLGYIPELPQRRLEEITNGDLKFNEAHLAPSHEESVYLPRYRYYSKELGLMCLVVSLLFQKGKKTRIGYKVNYNDKKIHTAFDERFLMQAVNVKDKHGIFVFEGDVVRYQKESKGCFYLFSDIWSLKELAALGEFEIIGNKYDGKDY